MVVHPSTRSVAIAVAIGVGLVEGLVAAQATMGPVIALPLAFGTAGSVIWAALAFDAMRRRQARPHRDDILAAGQLQAANRMTIKKQAERVARTEQALALLSATPMLTEAEARIATAAQRVERWDTVAATLPSWLEARGAWAGIVRRLAPAIVADLDAHDENEVHAARQRLPVDRHFSGQDLNAAAIYLVLSDRLEAARERWTAHRQAAADRLLDDIRPH